MNLKAHSTFHASTRRQVAEDGERGGVVRLAEEVVIFGRVFSVERDGRVARTFET